MNILTKLFGFDAQTMSLKKEIIAGVTTFLTMAYIIAVNPDMLSLTGMDKGAVFTATVLASIFATLVMAVYAKLPFALAPAMGLNAFFVFTIVMAMGYSWPFALTAVFLEGLIFVVLTLTGVRERIVNAIPLVLRNAISPGIGLFITFIGLQSAGIVVKNDSTIVALGNLHDQGVLLAVFGFLICSVMLIRKVTGALLIGIVTTSLVGIPLGLTHIDSIYSLPPSVAPVAFHIEWSSICSLDMLVCVGTLLFMDMFDTIGTLIGTGQKAGFVDKEGRFPQLNRAMMADALGTTAGALMGTSTVSTFVESSAGVNAGGRSGVTSLVTALCFMLSLLFAPLFLSIPSQATAPVLVLVGIMMISGIEKMPFDDMSEAIPCFVCIFMMPFTYSIAEGILLATITYVVLNLLSGHRHRLNASLYFLAIIFVLKYLFIH